MKDITIKINDKVVDTIKSARDLAITLHEYDSIDEILDDFALDYDIYEERDFFRLPVKFVVDHKEELAPVFRLLAIDAAVFGADVEGPVKAEVLVNGKPVFEDTIDPADYGV